MSTNFRKSKSFGGFRINVGKSGISTSVGVKGARVSLNSKGEVHRTVGIPGTGIYNRKKISGFSKTEDVADDYNDESKDSFQNDFEYYQLIKKQLAAEVSKNEKLIKQWKACKTLYLSVGIIFALIGMVSFSSDKIISVLLIFLGILFVLLSVNFSNKANSIKVLVDNASRNLNKGEEKSQTVVNPDTSPEKNSNFSH